MTFNTLAALSARHLRAIHEPGGLQWPFALWLRFTLLGERYEHHRRSNRLRHHVACADHHGGADVSALEYLGLGAICLAAAYVVGWCIAKINP